MALIKCPDCGRDVSDLAPACLNCGRPTAGMHPVVPQPAPPPLDDGRTEVAPKGSFDRWLAAGDVWIGPGKPSKPQQPTSAKEVATNTVGCLILLVLQIGVCGFCGYYLAPDPRSRSAAPVPSTPNRAAARTPEPAPPLELGKWLNDPAQVIRPVWVKEDVSALTNVFGAQWAARGLVAAFPLAVLGNDYEVVVLYRDKPPLGEGPNGTELRGVNLDWKK